MEAYNNGVRDAQFSMEGLEEERRHGGRGRDRSKEAVAVTVAETGHRGGGRGSNEG